MKFTPLTEEELQMSSLVPEGVYSYQVVKAEDTVSRAGNEYIKLTIKVWDNEGKEHMIFTNLALVKLLKHFCDVNGLANEYKAGFIQAESCLFKSDGRVMIGVEGEKPNPAGGMYSAKNIVKDYITAPHGSTMKPLPDVKNDFISDEIPF